MNIGNDLQFALLLAFARAKITDVPTAFRIAKRVVIGSSANIQARSGGNIFPVDGCDVVVVCPNRENGLVERVEGDKQTEEKQDQGDLICVSAAFSRGWMVIHNQIIGF